MIFWPKKVAFSLCGIAALGAILIFIQVVIHPSDRALYQKLAQETSALRSSKSLERHPTFQLREDAQKDFWTVRENERVHFQMRADRSKLSLKQKKDKVEATEELEQMTCMSQIGYLTAAQGAYDYPGYNFVASQVECTHVLGNLKAEKALLQSMQLLSLNDGVCLTTSHPFSITSQSALCEMTPKKTFSFPQQQKITFFHRVVIQMMEDLKAEGGSAIYKIGSLVLYPEMPKLHCHLQRADSRVDAQEIHFDLLKKTILCQKAKGKIPLEEGTPLSFSSDTLLLQNNWIQLNQNVQIEQAEKFSIYADFAKVTLKDQKPDFVEMTDNVRLFSPCIQNKDAFALAEKIVLHPKQQVLILTAISPKRVLFWQEGVSLSAPEIHIQKDLVTRQEWIQGKGDIHFTFNSEEQNIIDQFISNYL